MNKLSRDRNKCSLKYGIAGLTLLFAFCGFAQAQMALSLKEYKTAQGELVNKRTNERKECASLAGNAQDICFAEVDGNDKIARAQLDARYEPTLRHQYDVKVAKAEADYAVAMERCDDRIGNSKDVCQKEAEATEAAVKANAKAAMEAAIASAEASEKAIDARQEANERKRDADYAVAKEKCDVYADQAKDDCLDQAKKQYDK